ncbi:MAG: hypothetical protein RIR66_1081 [Actinomycetota bacterium]|jgi:fructokinase
MAKITVLGEVVIDRIHSNGQSKDIAGGSAANCALALSKIGEEVFFRARYSTDTAGDFLHATATSNGLNVSQSIRAKEPATIVDVFLNPSGSPTYEFHMNGTADWAWKPSELEQFPISDSDALVFGSLAAVLQPAHDALIPWITTAKGSGTLIAYDPNARPSAVTPSDADQVRQRILKIVSISNIVKVSDEDLEWINPGVDPSKQASLWSTQGPEIVVLTKGAHGAAAFRNGLCIANVPGVKTNVVDTVGAGDTLMAWLISGLLSFDSDLRFNAGSVESVVHRAVKAAAITCSRAGCQPPSLAELGL